MKTYEIYSDGAATMKKIGGEYTRCAGGWAFAVVDNNNEVSVSHYGGEPETTNNRMELMAIYEALQFACDAYDRMDQWNIKIYSDSAYCVNIFTSWIKGWEQNGWRRGKKKELIENVELIKNIWYLIKSMEQNFHDVQFVKVKGHSDNVWNNFVDELAVKGKKEAENLGKTISF